MILMFVAASAQAQSNLVLPRSSADMKALIGVPDAAHCAVVGIVTNVQVRRLETMRKPGFPTASSPELVATPLVGKGKLERCPSSRGRQNVTYSIAIKYENGQYVVFEQNHKPRVAKGDGVRVVDGRVMFR